MQKEQGPATRLGTEEGIEVYLPRVALAAAPLILTTAAHALSLQEFITCIGAQGQGSVCQLDAGTYQISSTLFIGRSNVTIKGTQVNSVPGTVLQRPPGMINPLLRAANLSSITFRDLTFDGNRAAQPAAYNSGIQPELAIFTVQSVLIANSNFINSANASLGFYFGTSGVAINGSTFSNSTAIGIYTGDPTSGSTQAPNAWMLCPTFTLPDNLLIANSTFQNNGEPAILGDATNVQLVNNMFINNQSNTVPFNDDGGQIGLNECSDNAALVGNTFANGIVGPNGKIADGLELHGTNMSLVNNLVINNAGDGIVLYGNQHAFIANWNAEAAVSGNNTFSSGQFPGVAIYNLPGWRPTDDILIDHAITVNGQQYGIQFANQTGVPFNHIAITNNCLAGNITAPIQLDNMGPDVVIAGNMTTGCGPN
jgi:hypothetical protein